MTITHKWCAGFESDGANSYATEADAIDKGGPSNNITSPTTNPKTGARHLRIYFPNGPFYGYAAGWRREVEATRQCRFGMFICPNWGYPENGAAYIVSQSGAAELWSLRAIQNTANIGLYVGGTLRATWAAATGSVYVYLQADVKIHSSTGWVKIYVEGVEVLSYTGNTGNEDIIEFALGPIFAYSSSSFTGGLYGFDVDDITFHDTTGEVAPGQSPTYRYGWIENPSADGTKKEWTCLTGTDHYAMIDEVPNDGDTSYNWASAAGLKDSFPHAAFTRLAGYAVDAVIPAPVAKRTDAGVITTLKGYALNGVDEGEGEEADLQTYYRTTTGSRLTVDPSTGIAWTDAGINNAEIGYESSGAFS